MTTVGEWALFLGCLGLARGAMAPLPSLRRAVALLAAVVVGYLLGSH